jgi:hypothetical protein
MRQRAIPLGQTIPEKAIRKEHIKARLFKSVLHLGKNEGTSDMIHSTQKSDIKSKQKTGPL